MPDPDGALDPFRDDLGASAVLCDVDGTLAPIVERPELSALLPGIRETLRELRPRVALLGFVSGRALADAERLVGLDGCAYAGNHGMELRLAGGPAQIAEEALPYAGAVADFRTAFRSDRLEAHGVWLEDKGVTLTFHFRTAPDPEAADAFLTQEVAPAAQAAGLRPTRGRMVLEVRPPAHIDKGTAVRALLRGSGARQAVYLGDDRTDLDAWAALRELVVERALERALAVGVLSPGVPPPVAQQADLTVDGAGDALAILRLLAGLPG